jgi:PAS domain S-box-containing protein
MEPRSSIRALVIEDDTEMASLLKRILNKKFSIDVDLAYDCASARRHMDDRDYDLITLDFRLPDGAGLDLLDEITGSGRPHPPVIMVTGHGDEETAARSFQSRASGYVVKDAKLPEVLGEAVQRALAEISLKRIEKELLDEKVFMEDVLDGLPDLFAVVDMDGKFFRWNRKVSEVTGYSNAEISKMNIVELFRAEDYAAMMDGMARLREDGFAVDEVVLLTRSGEVRNYELAGRLLRNFDGIPMGYSGIGRDITDRVAASGELTHYSDELARLVEERTAELVAANEAYKRELAERIVAEEHYRSVLENSMDVLAVFDADAVVVDISPSIEPMLGYKPDEIKGKSIFEFIHPDDLVAVVETHNGVAGGSRQGDHMKTRFRHRDGSWRALSAVGSLYRGEDGEVRIIVNARDVSAAELGQEALRQNEERYRNIFELSPDFIFLVEKGGKMIHANDAMIERAGMPLAELCQRTYMDFFAGTDASEIKEAVRRLRAGEEVRGLEVPARNALGEEALYEVNAIPIKEGSEVVRVLCLARDITSRKESEEELKRLNRELEGYAQTVSHDLRSPLTAIKLAGDNLNTIMKKKDLVEDLDEEVGRCAEVILESASRAEALIEDLLVLARAGQEPEEVSEVDVSETVRRIIEEHEPAIQERGVTVVLSEDLGRVVANPTHVYQVFSNLIDNAIKYNVSPGPVVEVKYLGRTATGQTYVVKDNGPGIPAGEIENVFLPFYKGEEGSTGIGLAIVEKLVNLYAGSIHVYTNGGTCFEFSLNDR